MKSKAVCGILLFSLMCSEEHKPAIEPAPPHRIQALKPEVKKAENNPVPKDARDYPETDRLIQFLNQCE